MVILQPEPRVTKVLDALLGLKTFCVSQQIFACSAQQSSLPLAFPVHTVNGNPPTRAQSHESSKVALWESKTGCLHIQMDSCLLNVTMIITTSHS
jgi:hypothetical protein